MYNICVLMDMIKILKATIRWYLKIENVRTNNGMRTPAKENKTFKATRNDECDAPGRLAQNRHR